MFRRSSRFGASSVVASCRIGCRRCRRRWLGESLVLNSSRHCFRAGQYTHMLYTTAQPPQPCTAVLNEAVSLTTTALKINKSTVAFSSRLSSRVEGDPNHWLAFLIWSCEHEPCHGVNYLHSWFGLGGSLLVPVSSRRFVRGRVRSPARYLLTSTDTYFVVGIHATGTVHTTR